jgi:hypothetical protein
LYRDLEKRIADIEALSLLFKEKGYIKTAEQIQAFIKILKARQIPDDFSEKLYALFVLFQEEFASEMTVGGTFRSRCFGETTNVVFKAISRLQSDFAKEIMTINPFLQQLNISMKTLGYIADIITKGKIADRIIAFHLLCYSYLVTIEGMFDEIARSYYFLACVGNGSIPKLQDLERIDVKEIRKKLPFTPVFLEGWEEKKHIRNAIGHARAEYDFAENQVRFRDADRRGNITWDSGHQSFEWFLVRAIEVEDSIKAFVNVFLLLRLYDLVLVPNPYS